MSVHWHKLRDANAAAEAGAHHIVNLLEEVLSGQEFVTLAVSGGTTPKVLFQKLAATRFPWDKVLTGGGVQRENHAMRSVRVDLF